MIDFRTLSIDRWLTPLFLVQPMDLTCVETQIGNGDPLDCEVVTLDADDGLPVVRVPA